MIPTFQDYMAEVKLGYVSRKVHPEDQNIVILNYTPDAVYSKQWNDVTLTCRGLILNEATGEVVAKPFEKFFNHGEIDDPLPSGNPETTVKQDGSLGILYRINESIRIATRGSFESVQAKAGQEMWDEKYSHLNERLLTDFCNLTLLFEIIHKETRVVVPYDFEDLVLIGVIDRFTGEDWTHKDMETVFGEWFRIMERFNGSFYEAQEKVKNMNHTQEGFVLRWGDYRLKVKSEAYLDVHRILYSLSQKQKIEYWRQEKLEELIRAVPEEFRKEIEGLGVDLDEYLSSTISLIDYFYYSAPKGTRKDFAIYVNSLTHDFKNLLFLKHDGKLNDTTIRDFVADKYYEIYREELNNG